jgi:hypothetical protein
VPSILLVWGRRPNSDALHSCGFDACEHEYPAMSRHGRKVPVSFYRRFTQDAVALADRYAQGRIISVLEGGYSDRALISGAMAHLCGLVDIQGLDIDENWWSVQNLDKVSPTRLYNLTKLDVVPQIARASNQEATRKSTTGYRTLDRAYYCDLIPHRCWLCSSSGKTAKASVVSEEQEKDRNIRELHDDDKNLAIPESSESQVSTAKKLPRVILRLGPHPDKAS